MKKYCDLDNKIKEMYLSGKSSVEIKKELGIKSHSIVQRHLKKMGINLRNTSKSIKLKYLNGMINGRKGKLKEVNLNKLKEEYISGKSTIELSNEFNISVTTVSNRLKGIGVKLRKHNELTKRTRLKMSKAKKGIKNLKTSIRMKLNNPSKTESFRKIMSKRMGGEGNNSWRGGISFEPYDRTFNNKFKRLIRKRDNQICMLCGIHREKLNRALDVHHINYDKLLSIKENCISLCGSCHMKTNFNRKHWIRLFQDLLFERYDYSYDFDNKVVIDLNNLHRCTNEI